MPGQVDVLLFAIRAAIRINEQVRRGFADMVKAEELHLPLPNFPDRPTVETARTYYEAPGAKYLPGDAELQSLFNRWQSLDAQETRVFVQRYHEHWALDETSAAPAGSVLNADLGWDDYKALLTIRQWRRGAEQTPSLLQRAAGTLIDIAVDYSVQVPGVVNTGTSQGRLVKAFLEAIDDIEFAEDARQAIGAHIVDAMFSSVLETLRDYPQIAADGERGQKLVKNVAGDLAQKAQDLVATLPSQGARERVQGFLQLLVPSLLRSTAETVIADPRLFLDTERDSQIELVSGVGKALLDAAGPNGLPVDKLFTPQTLDACLKAALRTVARFPDAIGAKGERAGALVAAIAQELSTATAAIGPELLPEIVRLTLEKSAEQLDVLLPDKNDQKRHLLVIALKQVLPALAKPAPPGSRWTPKLGAVDALAIADAVVMEVVQNPAWVEDAAGKANPILGELVTALIEELRSRGSSRLRRSTAAAILVAGIKAVGQRVDLFSKDPQGRLIVGVIVGAILKTVQDQAGQPKVAWLFAREEALLQLVSLVMEELARAGTSKILIPGVQAFLDETVARIASGKAWTWADLRALLQQELPGGSA